MFAEKVSRKKIRFLKIGFQKCLPKNFNKIKRVF